MYRASPRSNESNLLLYEMREFALSVWIFPLDFVLIAYLAFWLVNRKLRGEVEDDRSFYCFSFLSFLSFSLPLFLFGNQHCRFSSRENRLCGNEAQCAGLDKSIIVRSVEMSCSIPAHSLGRVHLTIVFQEYGCIACFIPICLYRFIRVRYSVNQFEVFSPDDLSIQ